MAFMRIVAVLVTLLAALPALAADRVALVIGNDGYSHLRPLTNAGSDAALIHRTLTEMGYDAGPAPLTDLGFAAFSRALRDFARKAQAAEIAVLYYAGHGMEIGGVNYLIPVDAELADDGSAAYEAVTLSDAMRPLAGAKSFGLVLLDACRNDPFANRARTAFRGDASPSFRGVERIESATPVAVAFAAELGRLSSDGEDGNSPYATALARHLPTPGLEFDDMLARVGRDVLSATRNAQNPDLRAPQAAYEGFALLPESTPVPEAPSDPVAVPADPNAAARADWGAISGSEDLAVFEAFIAEHPQATTYVKLAREQIAKLRKPVPPKDPYPAGQVFRDCASCPEMVVIPAGTFLMGSPNTETGRASDEGPQTPVTVASFALAKTEVTFDQWAACVQGGGCKGNPEPDDSYFGRGDRPVINVSWNHAQEYVTWLNDQAEGSPYRLPSEAEWEYAAQAGTETAYPWGSRWDAGRANGWKGGPGGTVPVSSYPANGFGLSDMIGNVWEWTEDCWHESYAQAPRTGAAWLEAGGGNCARRVIRGGSWFNVRSDLRTAFRHWVEPGIRSNSFGFRPVRTLTP